MRTLWDFVLVISEFPYLVNTGEGRLVGQRTVEGQGDTQSKVSSATC